MTIFDAVQNISHEHCFHTNERDNLPERETENIPQTKPNLKIKSPLKTNKN